MGQLPFGLGQIALINPRLRQQRLADQPVIVVGQRRQLVQAGRVGIALADALRQQHRLIDAFVLRLRVKQIGFVFGCHRLRRGGVQTAENGLRLVRLLQIEVGGRRPALGIIRHRAPFRLQGLIFAHHFGHSITRQQRAQAIDARLLVAVLRLRQRPPLRQQLVIARQRAVGDDETFLFTASIDKRQPHQLGGFIRLQAPLLRGRQCQPLAFTQRRIRDPIRRQQRHVISLNTGVGRRQRAGMSGVFQRRPAAAGGLVHIGARQIPRRRLQQFLRFGRLRLRLRILPGIRQRHHIATL